MNSYFEPNGWLAWVLVLLVIAGFTGWFTAEADNRVLLRQVHHLQKQGN